MPLNNTMKNLMLEEFASLAIYASLHTAFPAGANEVSGGSPAYARKSINWAAASGGSISAQATFPVFDVPACTVAAMGFYSAVTAGTLYGDYDLTDEVFAGQGTYTLTAITVDLNG